MATRHQVRQSIVSLLYAAQLNQENKDFINEFLDEKKIRNDQRKFTLDLYNGINEQLALLDEKINECLKEHKLDGVASIEKAILRLGAYEILFTSTQKAIIINEAIELAKEMAGDNAPKFINGVLDKINKEVQ
ncbi:TPA: transcription antitermination factor NusB [Campylobacter lari]|uniref:Transcription antitermination protein NusB n=1 Tax=Campylobacter lari (strain RM2100 / D67 / ATCC BAA-1060) TaxID=306263 RepID=NUSB_CAMLR|nr:transcription antitermination factor NusB [Campylobacter lari]B9KFP0.1 RecName: Full=Transcription antitermination protein NusB; AltName: Full=Antitermination factor NusB [Campylobacter lari RM2100]ACM63875.1 transcription antitermination protein [Campylobacter lari RM2100]EAI8647213.1 transcription antitermination factor NusB [Campylobacter lari]EAJ0334306.1 transcription antitermination factor NusB [Campylobacter lari]EAJ0336792.1 transcription antitermination factor NusB [Campylobacter l